MKKKNIYKKWCFIKPVIIAAFVAVAGIAAVAASSSGADGDGGIVIGDDTTRKEGGSAPADGAVLSGHTDTSVKDVSVQKEISETEKTDGATEHEEEAVVYICGEVYDPGLYKCDENTRIADVVDMAGGLKPEADDACVNMAAKVTDSQQIVIFKKGESGGAAASVGSNTGSSQAPPSSGGGLVNINTADETLLKSLPGIGEQKAKAIIGFRQDGGSFSRIEDIMKVPGIKDGVFNKIRDMITV